MNNHQPSSTTNPVAPDPVLVRKLNDAFRTSFRGGRVMLTAGVAALPETVRTALLTAVQAFDRFDADNDPHNEHDFGAIEAGGVRAFWKLDAFDRALQLHSPAPANPAVTTRVLTIMLAEE